MTRVVGVRWREADPVRYAKAGDLSLPVKSHVVVQLEKSQELAWVCREVSELVACQPDEELIPYLDAYWSFVSESGIVYAYSEHVVVSNKYRYAGTLDRAGYLRFGKYPQDLHLIDIKCVAQVSDATALQTAGYALALAEQEDVRVTRRAALQLKPDGKYRLHDYNNDADYPNWLACVRVTNWRLEHGLLKREN